jgi:Uma2 family endonuclease
MLALPKRKMNVDEYLAWAEDQPGRFELYAGEIYAIAPEGAEHAESNSLCRRRCSRVSGAPASVATCCRME